MNRILIKVRNRVPQIFSGCINGIYEWSLRARLRNDDFSILCSNCIGGIIYHRLGKRFLSPTVNMWMHQGDFLRFISDLPGYLAQELTFIDSKYPYPVAELSIGAETITLYFNHSLSREEAQRDWTRRKERIRYNNLYIIMYDRDGITKEDIMRLQDIPCRNKAVISENTYPDIPYVITMQGNNRPNGPQCLDKDWLGLRSFEKKFDFVRWLNA